MSGSGRTVIGLLVRHNRRMPDMEFLAPLATLGTGIMNSLTSASNTQEQLQAQQAMQAQSEQFNASQAELNRQYQTQMSNTAYQRASVDMKAAGLNPMMMTGGSMNASSPSGSVASTGTPSVPMPQNVSPLSKLGDAAQAYVNSAIATKTIDKLTEEVANLQTERGKITAETGATQAREGLTRQETQTERARTDVVRSESTTAAERAAESFSKMKLPSWLFDTAVQGGFLGKNTAEALSPINLGFGVRALRDVIKNF